jgi:hypothetical protein
MQASELSPYPMQHCKAESSSETDFFGAAILILSKAASRKYLLHLDYAHRERLEGSLS